MKYLLTIVILFQIAQLSVEADQEAIRKELIWHMSKERKEEEKPETNILDEKSIQTLIDHTFGPIQGLAYHIKYFDKIHDYKEREVERTYFHRDGTTISHTVIVEISKAEMNDYIDRLVQSYQSPKMKSNMESMKDQMARNPERFRKEPGKVR